MPARTDVHEFDLSPEERKILRKFLRGYSVPKIAEDLGLPDSVVEERISLLLARASRGEINS